MTKPVRHWFNNGYLDLRVPEGSDDGFQGNTLRIGGGEAALLLRISVLRTRPARKGGPATAEEALRLTRFAPVGSIELLDGDRAVLTHVVPPSEEDAGRVTHVWHLALPGPEAAIVVAIFSLEICAERPETRAIVETLAAEVRSAQFVFFDEDSKGEAADLEDG